MAGYRYLSLQGRFAGFLPLSAIPQRFNFNFRNHRKIFIIDGKTVFTGGTNIGKEYLYIVSAFYIVYSTMFVNMGVMRGAGDTIIPMLITLFSLWLIRIPLAWVMSEYFGYHGIWWSIPMAWISGMTLSYIYYRSGKWKKKSIVKMKPAITAEV